MKLTMVRFYLEAKTKDDLIIAQIKNNAIRGTWFDYSVPIRDKNIWICWYYDDAMMRVN